MISKMYFLLFSICWNGDFASQRRRFHELAATISDRPTIYQTADAWRSSESGTNRHSGPPFRHGRPARALGPDGDNVLPADAARRDLHSWRFQNWVPVLIMQGVVAINRQVIADSACLPLVAFLRGIPPL